MFAKTLIAAAAAVPLFVLSGAANADSLVYSGGPKSSVMMRVASPTVEVGKPYAQVVPGTTVGRTTNRHIYSGGPKGSAVHGR
jgi:hypothetical protein